MRRLCLPALGLALSTVACSSSDSTPAAAGAAACTASLTPSSDDTTKVQQALIEAKSGGVVCFGAGTYSFTDELSLAASGVTLRGVPGAILDFSKQVAGANAIAITGNGDVVDGLTIQNPKGDGVRATEVDGVAFKNTTVIWTKGPDTGNGAYGLYPVQSKRVLIENCKVSGASDAGIYVGQSRNIVVRNNEVSQSVAGIEIENSTDADVYGNHSHENVGGILVFALPGLPQLDSARAKVHDNLVENNDTMNFAAAGNIVKIVPSGTGLLLMASDGNEFASNTVRGNVSIGITVLSWATTGMPEMDPKYDKFPESNFVHDNTFEMNGTAPRDTAATVAALIHTMTIPQMSWDGETDPAKSNADGSLTNCFQNNANADFVQFDYAHLAKNASKDLTPYTCSHPAVAAVDTTGFPGAP